MVLYETYSWIHLSIGTPGRMFRWVFGELGVTATLFLIGLRWGPVGIASAWAASFWILIGFAFHYAGKPIGLGFATLASATWRYVAAAILAFGSCTLILHAFPVLAALSGWEGSLTRATIGSVAYGLLYLGGITLLHRGMVSIWDLVLLLREMILPARFASSVPSAVSDCCD